jgi:hypothetical protein
LDGELHESHNSFKGKIFKFDEFGNILQAMPVQAPLFIFLDLLVMVIAYFSTFKKKEPKTGSKRKIKIFDTKGSPTKAITKKSPREISKSTEKSEKTSLVVPNKCLNFMKGLQLMWIETNITDFGFYTLLNISIFPNFNKNTLTMNHWCGLIVSGYILSRIIYLYLRVYINLETICFVDNFNTDEKKTNPLVLKVSAVEKEIALEGINENIKPWNRIYFSRLNFIFRSQLIIIPALIVTGQNMKTPVCITLALIQIGSIYYYISLRVRFGKKVFSNFLYLLSYFSITGILLIISILGLYLDEWHTGEYAKVHSLTLKGKNIDQNLTLVILSLIALSLLLELIKAAAGILCKSKIERKFFSIDEYLRKRNARRSKHLGFAPTTFKEAKLFTPSKKQKTKVKASRKKRKMTNIQVSLQRKVTLK